MQLTTFLDDFKKITVNNIRAHLVALKKPLGRSWTPLYMDGELFAIFFISETGRDTKKIF